MTLPLLRRALLPSLPASPSTVSGAELLRLPEKVLQFGTGVLLRGLPDYFIDKSNRAGVFNGRIVVVKSTDTGSTDAFAAQDNLYTVSVRGLTAGKKQESDELNAAISRVLNAGAQWDEVLACADNPDLVLVISNTTEVGIVFSPDPPDARPPASFPGKLLALLRRRFETFRGDETKGLVIIPTELLPDNGEKLRAIVWQLAETWQLPADFTRWLTECNQFCSSLVDCIVPGALSGPQKTAKEAALGYRDDLLIATEVYRLWAIQAAAPAVAQVCSFAATDDRVVIAADISPFRERKLRLLNGPHTFSSGLARAAGFTLVREAMNDADFLCFLRSLMFNEIIPVLTAGFLPEDSTKAFADDVLDRFANPFIDHKWKDITLQYTTKMRMRNLQLLLDGHRLSGAVPPAMALGFAAWLWYLRPRAETGNGFAPVRQPEEAIRDDKADRLATHWRAGDTAAVVSAALSDEMLWDTDLTRIDGFAAAVTRWLDDLLANGGKETLRHFAQTTGKK